MTDDEKLKVYTAGVEALKDALKIQCYDGNWNYDPYMHGLANGLIYALGLFDYPIAFLEPPEEWLCDKTNTEEVLGGEEIGCENS